MNEVNAKSQFAKIRNFEKGFMSIHLIDIGSKLGIFEVLNDAKNGISINDLSSKLNLHEPYVRIWCQTAYHFEIIDCDDNGNFKLQPFLDELLGDRSNVKNYLSNISLISFAGQGMKDASALFKNGGVVESYNTPHFSEIVYTASKNIYLVYLFMILPKNEKLKQLLDNGIRFLDIGCGNGNLIIQLAQHFKKSSFAGINPDVHGVREGENTISELKIDNVRLERLGGEKIDYIEEFDMVNMAVTLHELPPAIRPSIIENVFRALKSGGHILILDFPYPGNIKDFRNPQYEYGIFDQFYEAFIGTVHLSTEEQTALLIEKGFKNIERIQIGKGMFEFVTAEK